MVGNGMATLARAATLRLISNLAASIATCALIVSAQLGTQGDGWVRRVFSSFNNDSSGVSAARLVVASAPLISAVNASGRNTALARNNRRPIVLSSVSPRVIPQNIAINKATPTMRQMATSAGDKTTN